MAFNYSINAGHFIQHAEHVCVYVIKLTNLRALIINIVFIKK